MRMVGFAVTLMVTVVIIATCVDGKEFLDHREIEVQKLLKQLNKPALKSIKSEDGDIIDCVPITSQAAFDHPLLKNHTIQMRPSFIPEGDDSTYTKKKSKATQVWRKNGECPEKTVAIRRIKREEILRAKSIERFGKKNHQSIPDSNPGKDHEYAIMNLNKGNDKYFGTSFVINLWKPEVQVPSEFSLAQTWLVSGVGNSRNTIEAGFQVYPGKYKDNNLRLFVFWTANGYQGSGCYNTDCAGFIQVSNRLAVGVSYYNTVSQYDGDQYELFIQIWKDGKNWWLKIDEELVGYWPGDLFNSLGNGARLVQWGGEIVNHKTDMIHTTTDMGSGRFADEGFKKASYFRNLKIVNEAKVTKDAEGIYPKATQDKCYNIKAGVGGSSWGFYFFYGGPGRNEQCP